MYGCTHARNMVVPIAMRLGRSDIGNTLTPQFKNTTSELRPYKTRRHDELCNTPGTKCHVTRLWHSADLLGNTVKLYSLL